MAYIIDTPRTTAPATFMSNMLYACRCAILPFYLRAYSNIPFSILYKTKLPFILVFNKVDAQPHDFALEWMTDFEAFQATPMSSPGGGPRYEDLPPTYDEAQQQALEDARAGRVPLEPSELDAHLLSLRDTRSAILLVCGKSWLIDLLIDTIEIWLRLLHSPRVLP